MRATSGRTITGKPSSQEPSERKFKETFGRLELKQPDFEVLNISAGSHRSIYHLEFKLKAIEYAPSLVEGGKGPRGMLARVTLPGHWEFPTRERWHCGSTTGPRTRRCNRRQRCLGPKGRKDNEKVVGEHREGFSPPET